MIHTTILEKDFEAIKQVYHTHIHPRVRQKALVIIMKYHQTPHHKIAKIAGVCENTVRNYLGEYREGGIKAITTINFYQPQSTLKTFDEVIKQYFTENPPSTLNQACAQIKDLTGIAVKNTQMRRYLASIKVTRRKVGSIPGNVNLEAQQKFHDEQLQPKLKEAKEGKRDLFFVDAAHFVLGGFLGFLWCFKRLFVRTPSGRQRFNVLGALNAITKQIITITNDTYITSLQVCELLTKLSENAQKPITIILDNARYQRCKMVMALAAELEIELLFLPPYSPNLNLIERLWKFTKAECLYSKYYENFSSFRQALQIFVDTAHQKHSEKLHSLLTLKFQLFSKEQIKQAL